MLILTRKMNERIFIGDGIAVVVVDIENNRVKLGIEAPSDVPILREEIVDDATRLKMDAKLRADSADGDRANAKTGTG